MVGRGPIAPTRRRFLTAAGLLLAAALSSRAGTADRPAPRLAAIDWALLETAMALDLAPVAATEMIRFHRDSGFAPPPGITDLGLRGAPNFELLQLTRPELILTSPFYDSYRSRLEAIAPVLSHAVYPPGQPPLPHAREAVTALARAVGRDDDGVRVLARADARMAVLRDRLASHRDRPVALINLGDARHLRAFGHDSLFGSTLSQLGLTNAWTGATAFSFLAPVPLERLAEMPEARLALVGEIPPEARRGLSRSHLWRALPQVRADRVTHLPQMNPYGGLPSALRMADALADALAGPASDGPQGRLGGGA